MVAKKEVQTVWTVSINAKVVLRVDLLLFCLFDALVSNENHSIEKTELLIEWLLFDRLAGFWDGPFWVKDFRLMLLAILGAGMMFLCSVSCTFAVNDLYKLRIRYLTNISYNRLSMYQLIFAKTLFCQKKVSYLKKSAIWENSKTFIHGSKV